jgi:hypothetical protein
MSEKRWEKFREGSNKAFKVKEGMVRPHKFLKRPVTKIEKGSKILKKGEIVKKMEKGGVKFKKAVTRLLKSKREESYPTSFSKRRVTKIGKGSKILKKGEK